MYKDIFIQLHNYIKSTVSDNANSKLVNCDDEV